MENDNQENFSSSTIESALTDEEPNLSPPVDDCQELEIEDSYTSDISCMVSSEELHELEVEDVLHELLLFQGGDNNDIEADNQ